ncbi:cellulase family glycosylhydrolase [Demequina sp.]|uniref:cellulase family glycosylhydrolase n=1 Tax=Demequina sp. TaxID=2050685 RepID=UPI003D0D4556
MAQETPRFRRAPWLVGAGALAAVVVAGGVWAATTKAPQASPTAQAPSATPSPSASGPVCTALLSVTKQWDGGYQAEVIVSARAPLANWEVGLNLEGGVVTASWDSTMPVGSTGITTAANASYNGTVTAGSTATFGFTANGGSPSDLSATCVGTATGPVSESQAAGPTPPPTYTSQANVASPGDDDWLHTDGNRIVDAQGRAVWLTGANWYGFNLEQRMLVGLNVANLDDLMDQIASRGINVIRVPVSTELLLEWRDGEARVPQAVNQQLNPGLADKTTLEVFDAFLGDAKDRGVKVFLDVHSALADDDGHLYPVWYNEPVSTADFLDAWTWVAARYANDDTVIGFDLKNEPHGQPSETPRAIWDASTAKHNWRHAAEQAGDAILAQNPHALVFVEGIEATPRTGTSFASTDNGDYSFGWWGGNLRFAAEFPVRLSEPRQLVYSPHEYGPLVYDQPWFQKPFTKDSLTTDVWEPNWLYLHQDGTAPLLIGEWGGRLGQDPRQDVWMAALRDLIVDEHLAHTFWCLNPESGDTGGLFANGWGSWDEEKYALLRPALWQTSGGRFVSLDHATPLPGGVSVTEYYDQGNPQPR